MIGTELPSHTTVGRFRVQAEGLELARRAKARSPPFLTCTTFARRYPPPAYSKDGTYHEIINAPGLEFLQVPRVRALGLIALIRRIEQAAKGITPCPRPLACG